MKDCLESPIEIKYDFSTKSIPVMYEEKSSYSLYQMFMKPMEAC